MSTESLCPKCSHPKISGVLDASSACSKCGLIFSKYNVAPTPRKKTDMNPSMLTVFIVIAIALVVGLGIGAIAYKTRIDVVLVDPKYQKSGDGWVVSNNGWDGSVFQVEKYLKTTLKDPESLQIIQWGKVTKDGQSYSVSVEYRAKNSFGGFVVETKKFILDSNGNVVSSY